MARLIIFLLFVNICWTNVHSQPVRQFLKYGKKAFETENYEAAAFYYEKAIQMNLSPAIAWKLAESARLGRNYVLAEKWYQFVSGQSAKAYPLCLFHRASVQKSMGLYQRAQVNYRKYYLANIKKKDYYTEKAKHEILSCENALFLTFEPLETEITKLDTNVNSAYSEFQLYHFRDSAIYFTSLRPDESRDTLNYFSKLILLETNNNTFNKIFADSSINISGKNISSFTFVGGNRNSVIFGVCDRIPGKFLCKLYRTVKEGGIWQLPEPLPEVINYPGASVTNPCYVSAAYGNYLLFASDRPEGLGKLDLWYSKVDSAGNYQEPVNLGKYINSPDDEFSPFWDNKEQTLYYSSEWFDNLGGTDIFYVQGHIESLKYPRNIGYPLNSKSHDVFYSISADRRYAYFSSNRTGATDSYASGCCNDIYRITLPEPLPDSVPDVQLETRLKQKSTELIPISLFFHNDEPNPRTWDTTTALNYETTVEAYLSLKDDYQKWWSQMAKAEDREKCLHEIENFFIDSVDRNYNKLLQFTQLTTDLLKKGQDVEITIKGFASPLNSSAYNINLSKRRVQSLVNYFREFNNGILVPYIDNPGQAGASLKIIREAFGEEMVVRGVSDDLRDLRNSVYSPHASRERKIAVIAVAFEEEE